MHKGDDGDNNNNNNNNNHIACVPFYVGVRVCVERRLCNKEVSCIHSAWNACNRIYSP